MATVTSTFPSRPARVLPDHLAVRLHRALGSFHMHYRNWSGGDEWVFAIYSVQDNYVGAVRLDEGSGRLFVRNDRMAIRDRRVLDKLCEAFAAESSLP